MPQLIMFAAAIASALLCLSPPARAESRGQPYSEAELLDRSARVFVGEVLATKTFDIFDRTVPTRAKVLLSLKGEVEPGELALRPKDPGLRAYFDEEFGPAEDSALGVFYVGTKEHPDLLLGYRVIAITPPPGCAAGDDPARPASKAR